MANSIYSTTMISNGGRDGRVFSPDNTFVQNLATPKEMGGQGGNDTNPEQLFAAGYSACFNSALSLILSQNKISDANQKLKSLLNYLKMILTMVLNLAQILKSHLKICPNKMLRNLWSKHINSVHTQKQHVVILTFR